MATLPLLVVNGPTTLTGNLNFGSNGAYGSIAYGDFRGKQTSDWRFTAGHDEQKIVFQNSINEALLTIDTETGQIIFDGSVASGTESLIANTTINSDDGEYVFCSAVSAGFTVTLPLASLSLGKKYSFVKTDATANVVTIDGAGSETINGVANSTLTSQYQSLTVVSNGVVWYQLGSAASVSLGAITTRVDNLTTLSGVATNVTSLGTFTGTTIPDNQNNKQAFQALETSLEAAITVNTTQTTNINNVQTNANNLITLSGVAANAANLGTFTGTTIADSSTVKTAFQSLETGLESAIAINVTQTSNIATNTANIATNTSDIATNTGDIATQTTRVDSLITLSGVANNSLNLGVFSGSIISDNTTVKNALQEVETSLDAAITVNTTQTTDISTVQTNANNLITLSGVATNATDLGTFSGVTIVDSSTIKTALQALETAVEAAGGGGSTTELITLSGVAAGSLDLGTFTGTTIPDNQNNKQAFQALETSLETNNTTTANLVTLSGVATNAVNLGSFTGTIIPDNQTVKASLQAIETSLDSAVSVNSTQTTNIANLVTLSGVATNATNLGTFTGTIIADSSTVKASLQALETSQGTNNTTTANLVTLSGVATNATNLGTFTGTTIADNQTIKASLQALETAVEAASGGVSGFPNGAVPYVLTNALTQEAAFNYDSASNTLTVGAISLASGTTDLDFYQQSTFTPTVVGSTVAGVGTYTTRTGKYTRIGNIVVFQIQIVLTAHTGTGDMSITGLPYLASQRTACAIHCSTLTFTDFQLGAYVEALSTTCEIRRAANAGADTGVPIDGTCSLWIQGSYLV